MYTKQGLQIRLSFRNDDSDANYYKQGSNGKKV